MITRIKALELSLVSSLEHQTFKCNLKASEGQGLSLLCRNVLGCKAPQLLYFSFPPNKRLQPLTLRCLK